MQVINQSALLSSSLENTSFGLEPKQGAALPVVCCQYVRLSEAYVAENVWYLQEPSADSITDTIAVFKSDSSEDVLTSTQASTVQHCAALQRLICLCRI